MVNLERGCKGDCGVIFWDILVEVRHRKTISGRRRTAEDGGCLERVKELGAARVWHNGECLDYETKEGCLVV